MKRKLHSNPREYVRKPARERNNARDATKAVNW